MREIPSALLADGRRGLPAARFPCWDTDMGLHHCSASDLWWFDGNDSRVPGWYCTHDWGTLFEGTPSWSLKDEILEVDGLGRLL